MSDSESIIKDDIDTDEPSKDNLSGLFETIIKKARLVDASILFVIIILINSDVFIENIMIFIPSTSIAGCPTTKGSVIQALFIIMIFIIASLFIS